MTQLIGTDTKERYARGVRNDHASEAIYMRPYDGSCHAETSGSCNLDMLEGDIPHRPSPSWGGLLDPN
jgi:hypothetical protein